MAANDLRQILDALPRLTSGELALVIGHAKLLVGNDDSFVGRLYCSISWEAGHNTLPPLPVVLSSTRTGPALRKAAEDVEQFLLSVFGRRLQRNEEARVLRILAQCLVNRLRRWKKPIIPTNVVLVINQARSILEEQFPGYMCAGILEDAILGDL